MAYKDNLSLIQQMLEISGSLDIETVGLRSGAGMHELAYGTFGRGAEVGAVNQFILEPSTVLSYDESGRVTPYVRGKPSFTYRPSNWQAVDAVNTMLAQGQQLYRKDLDQLASSFIKSKSGTEFVRQLSVENEFRANTYKSGKFPYLPRISGDEIVQPLSLSEEEIRQSTLRFAKEANLPINRLTTQKLAVEDLLIKDSTLSNRLRHNITWIANAQFESRQIGAHLEVLEKTLTERAIAEGIEEKTAIKQAQAGTFRGSLSMQNPRQTGILYTTGSEYNRARAAALTGKSEEGWRGVWKALLRNTKAGDVRDIFDVIKAQEEYVRQLAPGLLPEQSLVTGGVDIQYRLMRAIEEGAPGLLATEAHIGALDVPVQEYMVKRLLPQTAALQAAAEGTEEGAELLRQARQGKGLIADVMRRLSMTTALMPDQQRANILKRLDDATADLVQKQVTDQHVRHKIVGVKQISREGAEAVVDVAIPQTKGYSSLQSVVDLMSQQGRYPEEMLQEEFAAYQTKMQGLSGEELRTASKAYVTERTLGLTSPEAKEAAFARLGGVQGSAQEGAEAFLAKYGRMPDTPIYGPKRGMRPPPVGGIARGGIAVAAGLAAAGVLAAFATGGRPAEPPPSMISQNYQQWLDTQNQFYGTRGSGSYMNGMSHTGVAGGRRSSMTDFGSPYQGPMAANYVFMQQDMLAERERFLRASFANIHSPSGGVLQFPSLSNDKYNFIQAGESAAGMSLPGIRGGDTTRILDLANYKIEVSDADTITVKRGGVRGALQSFFGFNRGYEFRLAGIDAPETFHGELGMKSAQPHADDATLALKAMIGESGSLQLVFDPENITYGRMVGAVIADGRNVNFDLVKRGHVAALPFYKAGTKPLVNLKGIERLEEFSRQSQVGMWAHPFFQVYSDVEDVTGKRITFNTFSRMSKVAQNANTMSLAALMQNAQDQGFVSTADRIAASDIGLRYNEAGFTEDYRNMLITPVAAAPHNSYLHQMSVDNANLMKTRGTPIKNPMSSRGGYGDLDKKLSIDSLGTTNSIWNKRKLASYETYGVESDRRRRRRQDMAASQRHALRNMFQSPIGHHRM